MLFAGLNHLAVEEKAARAHDGDEKPFWDYHEQVSLE